MYIFYKICVANFVKDDIIKIKRKAKGAPFAEDYIFSNDPLADSYKK